MVAGLEVTCSEVCLKVEVSEAEGFASASGKVVTIYSRMQV